MKKFALMTVMGLCLGFAACDDYEEPNPAPQQNEQEAIFEVGGVVATPNAAQIDLNALAAEEGLAKVLTVDAANVPEGYELNMVMEFAKDAEFASVVEIPAPVVENEVFVDAKTLNATYKTVTKDPAAAQVSVRFAGYLVNGKSKVRIGDSADSYFGPFTLTVLPVAPEKTIESAYTLQYSADGATWVDVPFNHSAASPYDDPEFKLSIEVTSDMKGANGMYWQIKSASGKIYNVAAENQTVNNGSLVEGGVAGLSKLEGPVQFTINMWDLTYSYVLANPYVYLVGNPNGWDPTNGDIYLYSAKCDNVFTGVVALEAGNYFRFFKSLGSWESPQVGAKENDGDNVEVVLTDGVFTSPAYNGKGCWFTNEAGNYRMTLDLNNMTFKMELIPDDPSTYTYLYIVGNINGWSQDIEAEGAKNGEMVCKNGSGIYEGTFDFPAAAADNPLSYFRFYSALGDWGSNCIGAADVDADIELEFEEGVAMWLLSSASEKNFIVPAGKYKVVVDTNEMILSITQLPE